VRQTKRLGLPNAVEGQIVQPALKQQVKFGNGRTKFSRRIMPVAPRPQAQQQQLVQLRLQHFIHRRRASYGLPRLRLVVSRLRVQALVQTQQQALLRRKMLPKIALIRRA
jgi:hypothetical protein